MSDDNITNSFLDPQFKTLIDGKNIENNRRFIVDKLKTFVGVHTRHQNFKEINIEVFKKMKPFIFYKAGYDYTKFLTIEKYFYIFLYMVDKLPDDASKLTPLEFKKIFLDASTFSRKVANPIASKSEKSFNTLFNALERGIINPSRVTRAKYKDELQELDSKFKDYQLNKLAEEEQERKLTNGLRELLKEQRGDKKAMTYIVNLLQEGTNLKLITTPSSSSGKNIGGSLIRGGTNGEAINSVVNYLKGVFTLTIKKETLDGIVLEDIKQFHSNYSALTTPLLPKHNGVVKNDLEDRATDVLTLLNITITTDIIDILKTDSVTISATTTTCTNAKQQETATIPKNFALNFIIYMYDTDKRVNISKYMESLIS